MNIPPNRMKAVPARTLKNTITIINIDITNIMMLKKQNNIIKATNAATNIDNRNDKDPTPQV
jgi:hypothetical protein